jgi:hypothetical protein
MASAINTYILTTRVKAEAVAVAVQNDHGDEITTRDRFPAWIA